MHKISYFRAKSTAHAIKRLKKTGNASLLAGGQTLLPAMKQRLASPGEVIDIGGLAELSFLKAHTNHLVIGATTTHAKVAVSAEAKNFCPALADLANNIGDPAVRNLGTIGGSIANNDPAADYPAACLALQATMVTNKREIAAEDFFTGLFSTALENHEVLCEINFTKPTHATYVKFPNPASRYALVGVFIARYAQDDTRVAVTGAGENGVFRATSIEKALNKSWQESSLKDIAIDKSSLLGDMFATRDYRANLIAVMARRGVKRMAHEDSLS